MNILLADEDEAFRDYLGMIIEEGFDCELFEVSSGNEALTIFEMDEEINLIISELNMKGGNGNTIYDYIKDKKLNIPFIWITDAANSNNKIIKNVLQDSVSNGFIPKPFKDSEIFPVIEKAMEEVENRIEDIVDKDGNVYKDEKEGFQNTKDPGQEDLIESSNNEEGSSQKNIDTKWRLDQKTDTSTRQEIKTDWVLKQDTKKNAAANDSDADWSLKMKKNGEKNSEKSADWSLENEKKGQGNSEENANWSLENEKKGQGNSEEDADWSLENEKKGQGNSEEDADWSLDKKKKGQGNSEEDADWSLEKKKKGQGDAEEDADWSLGKKKKGQGDAEENADWSLEQKKKGNRGNPENNADSSQANNKKNIQTSNAEQNLEKEKNKPTQKKQGKSKDDDEKDSSDENYVKVKTKRFLNFNSVCCDVFIRLPKKKFLKLFHAKDHYDKERIELYIKKKQRYLYVRREDYQAFQETFSQLIFSKLASKKLTTDQRSLGELVAYTHIHEQIKEIGISPVVAKQAKQAIESSITLMKSDPSLHDLFQKIMRGNDFISEHSLLLTYICGQICSKVSWKSDTTLQKLSMACLLHDVGLTDPELAKIDGIESPEAQELSTEDMKTLVAHPSKSAEIIRQAKELYSDVDVIVSQHHERPDGNGYPRGLAPNSVSPLSCIFIIAEDYALKIIGKKENEINFKAIKEEFEVKYKKGNFRKPLEGFIKGFGKKF